MFRDDLKSALKESMLARDTEKTAALRLIAAALKDKDIAVRPDKDGIDEDAFLQMLQSMIKQRRESIEMYEKGNRADLVAKEQFEIDVIQTFLPTPLTAEETEAAVADALKETGAASMRDMGKVMAVLKAKYAGRMDFSSVAGVIKKQLA